MYPTRKKYKCALTASDPQLWAIGMIVVQWTNLEQLFGFMANALCKHDPALQEEFNTTRAADTRLKLFEDMVRNFVREPARQQLLETITKAKSLKDQRDTIVHNLWSGNEPADLENPEANSVFNWQPPFPNFEWKIDFGRLKRVSIEMDILYHQVGNILAAAAGYPKSFTFSSALQKISNIPNHDQ